MQVHLVNPGRQELDGVPCHATIEEIEAEVDLAFVAVPGDSVLDVLRAAQRRSVGAAIVVSAGFGESRSAEGQHHLDALRAFSRDSDMAICGPSCLGFANVVEQRDLFATGTPGRIPAGRIALISQSGGTLSGLIRSATARNLGFSQIVSSGGEACLDCCDYLDYILETPETRAVCLFLEDLRDPDRFLTLCRRAAERDIALSCIKIGQSEPGQRAALGHTGAITGADDYFEALFDAGGVARCFSVEDMLDGIAVLAQAAAAAQPTGDRLAIVTVSGGTGTLLADLATRAGLNIPPLGAEARAAIEATVPARLRIDNPVDIPAQVRGGDRAIWNGAIAAMAASGDFDAVLVADLHENDASHVADLADVAQEHGTPVLLTSSTDGLTIAGPDAVAKAGQLGLPMLRGARAAVHGIAAAVRQHRARQSVLTQPASWWLPAAIDATLPGTFSIPPPLAEGSAPLNELEWRALFARTGFPGPREIFLTETDDAAEAAWTLRPPFAVKGVAAGIVHKVAAGLVALGIPDREAVVAEIGRMAAAAAASGIYVEGWIVQEMATNSEAELYVSCVSEGGRRPMVTLGLGGGNVESGRRFSRRLAPVSIGTALNMIAQATDLVSHRATPRAAEAVATLSQIAMANRGSIELIEINPILLCGNGEAIAVDTVVGLSQPRPE